MEIRSTRRDMLKSTAALGVGYWLGTSAIADVRAAPSEKLNVAFVGIGGRGRDNLNGISGHSVNVVALCDVDDERAGDAYEAFPQAKKFFDFRRMFDELEQQIDAVVVSTPDHTHFHPAKMALERGKHLYCEKPLGHTVVETRSLTNLARRNKVATQLGTQRHAMSNFHRVVEILQSGAIGRVQECHAWVDGSRGMPEMPTEFPAVPSQLKWDLWLGPCADRPYSPAYCPYEWRFWWDFGTGETGNMGCHILDIPYTALGLKYPTSVIVPPCEPHPQTSPRSMEVRFEFPAEGDRSPVTLHWYHADNGPSIVHELGVDTKGTNQLYIGSEGMLLCGFGRYKLLPEEKFADFQPPPQTFPDSPGFYREWIDACQGGSPATCHFDYSGPLTETVLLGNAAYRAGGGEYAWDGGQLQASGSSSIETYLTQAYRKGWEVATV